MPATSRPPDGAAHIYRKNFKDYLVTYFIQIPCVSVFDRSPFTVLKVPWLGLNISHILKFLTKAKREHRSTDLLLASKTHYQVNSFNPWTFQSGKQTLRTYVRKEENFAIKDV